jgi:hypothetical protein
MTRIAFAAALAACWTGNPPPPTPAPAPTPKHVVQPQPCQENWTVWDATASECRLFPGGGYGWAGCSEAKAPKGPYKCFSFSHWANCTCECDAGQWDETARRCL